MGESNLGGDSSRRPQIKSCEIDLNLKKDVIRPSSAKIDTRTRTPGAIINNISQRNEIVQRVSPSRIQINSTKNYTPVNNILSNDRLKNSPSTGSLSSNKAIVPVAVNPNRK